MKRKNKNVSKRVPNGRTVQTRDEFFFGHKNYRKPGYEHKGPYRKAVVVDSNKRDELAVVKLTTSPKGRSIVGEKKSKYKPFIETLDDDGKPIKLGKKFQENPSRKDLSKRAVDAIKRDSVTDPVTGKKNRARLRKLKNRQKKKHRD